MTPAKRKKVKNEGDDDYGGDDDDDQGMYDLNMQVNV